MMNEPAWLHTQVPVQMRREELPEHARPIWDKLVALATEAIKAGCDHNSFLTLEHEAWYTAQNIVSDERYEEWQRGQNVSGTTTGEGGAGGESVPGPKAGVRRNRKAKR